MKTRNILKGIGTALMLMAGAMQLQAQEVVDAEAFYVYRNDGDFNGFFFDQVTDMRYSKVDYEGVEHDEYVIQEIETPDSLYRIPLAAIDSIGFQQPEFRLAPRCHIVDDEELRRYVWGMTDARTIWLDPNTPADVLPQEGDVLLSFHLAGFNYEGVDDFGGFSGKVTKVEKEASRYLVHTEKLSALSDVFDQFISCERIGVDEDGEAVRYVAGYNRMPRRSKGSDEFYLINLDGNFKSEFEPADNVSVSLEAAVGLKVYMEIVYNITWRRLYVKTTINSQFAFTPTLQMKASGALEGSMPGLPKLLKTIKFPANLPIFQTEPLPEFYMKFSGSAAMKLTFPQNIYTLGTTIIFDSNDLPWMMSFNKAEKVPDELIKEEAEAAGADFQVSLEGSAQIGVMLRANIATNDWIEDIFSSEIGLYTLVGPKLSGAVDFSARDLVELGGYGTLKDMHVDFSPVSVDAEAKAKLAFMFFEPKERSFFEFSKPFGQMTARPVPVFDEQSQVIYTPSPKAGRIGVTLYPKDNTIVDNYLGASIEGFGTEWADRPYYKWGSKRNEEVENYQVSFDGLAPGLYHVTPYVKALGMEIPMSHLSTTIDLPAYFELHPDSLHFPGTGGTKTVSIETNYKPDDISVESPYEGISAKLSSNAKSATITVAPNPYPYFLSGHKEVVFSFQGRVDEVSLPISRGPRAMEVTDVKFDYSKAPTALTQEVNDAGQPLTDGWGDFIKLTGSLSDTIYTITGKGSMRWTNPETEAHWKDISYDINYVISVGRYPRVINGKATLQFTEHMLNEELEDRVYSEGSVTCTANSADSNILFHTDPDENGKTYFEIRGGRTKNYFHDNVSGYGTVDETIEGSYISGFYYQ